MKHLLMAWAVAGFLTLSATAAESVFGETPLEQLQLHGPKGQQAKLQVARVADAPGERVARIEVPEAVLPSWHIMVRGLSEKPVRKGDTIELRLHVRGGRLGIAGSEGSIGFGIKAIDGGKRHEIVRENTLLTSDEWQPWSKAGRAPWDMDAGELELVLSVGELAQFVEIADLQVINHGPEVDPQTLNPPPAPLGYAGREMDAPWRKAAEQRIAEHRMGDLVVEVVDGAGKPVPDAEVHVAMREHAFDFGTSTMPAHRLHPDSAHYDSRAEQTIHDLFNLITVDIETKWKGWNPDPGTTESELARRERIIAGLKRQDEAGMRIRGHTLVWPGWRTNPQWLEDLGGDPAALKKAIEDHIEDLVTRTRPYIDEWDVVNEPLGDYDITQILGEASLAHWYKVTREHHPDAFLWIQEGGLTGPGKVARQEQMLRLIKVIQDNGGPVQGVSFHSHFGSRPPSPEEALATWDRFHEQTGLALKVGEFDVKTGTWETRDDQFEADYLRDLLIAAFSHPAMRSFTMWGFHDEMHWKRNAPLFAANWKPKPGLKVWKDLVFDRWWTDVRGRADADGRYAVRGFLGDYEITVAHDGRTTRVLATLTRDGATVKATLK